MEINNYFILVLLICIVFIFQEIKNLKIQVNKNVEHMTAVKSAPSDVETIRNLIREEYNHDVEAIRNLGTISKSLLTGKNYHNTTGITPGRLIIPADVEIQGNLIVNGNTYCRRSTFVSHNLDTEGNIGCKGQIYFNRPQNSLVLTYNHTETTLRSILLDHMNQDRWETGFMFGHGTHNPERRGFTNYEKQMKQSDRSNEDHIQFYVHSTEIGGTDKHLLEIACRGIYDRLRLFQRHHGFDLTKDNIYRLGQPRVPLLARGTNVRYVILKNSDYLHIKFIRIYTTAGIELINAWTGSGRLIGDQSFNEIDNANAWPWNLRLFRCGNGNREAYKVRGWITNNNGQWYYHGNRGRSWRVDLGRRYEIAKVEFDIGHAYHRYNTCDIVLSNNEFGHNPEFHKRISEDGTRTGNMVTITMSKT